MAEEDDHPQQQGDGTAPVGQDKPKGTNAPPEHPISYWEEKLIGKKLVPEDAVSDKSSVSACVP